jgi:hypothetical protein
LHRQKEDPIAKLGIAVEEDFRDSRPPPLLLYRFHLKERDLNPAGPAREDQTIPVECDVADSQAEV